MFSRSEQEESKVAQLTKWSERSKKKRRYMALAVGLTLSVAVAAFSVTPEGTWYREKLCRSEKICIGMNYANLGPPTRPMAFDYGDCW